MTNCEQEECWIEAWSDLYEILEVLPRGPHAARCLLDDGSVVDVERCKGWLQSSCYGNWQVKVERGWVLGKPGIIATRWRETN